MNAARRTPTVTHCKHCGATRPKKPRGLCSPCYRDLAVRDKYPPARVCTQHRPPDPTPEEIAAEAERIRKEWFRAD